MSRYVRIVSLFLVLGAMLFIAYDKLINKVDTAITNPESCDTPEAMAGKCESEQLSTSTTESDGIEQDKTPAKEHSGKDPYMTASPEINESKRDLSDEMNKQQIVNDNPGELRYTEMKMNPGEIRELPANSNPGPIRKAIINETP